MARLEFSKSQHVIGTTPQPTMPSRPKPPISNSHHSHPLPLTTIYSCLRFFSMAAIPHRVDPTLQVQCPHEDCGHWHEPRMANAGDHSNYEEQTIVEVRHAASQPETLLTSRSARSFTSSAHASTESPSVSLQCYAQISLPNSLRQPVRGVSHHTPGVHRGSAATCVGALARVVATKTAPRNPAKVAAPVVTAQRKGMEKPQSRSKGSISCS